jgi:WD40 repeat protein
MDADADALPPGLLGLHDALRRARFVVGPGELLAATRLLARLRDAGRMPDEVEQLEPMLRAVYCKSAPDQNRFHAVFKRWREQAARAQPEEPEPAQKPEPTTLSTGALPDAADSSQRLMVIGAVGLAFVLAVAVWLASSVRDAVRPTSMPAVQATAPAPTTGPPGARPQPDAATPEVPVAAAAAREGIAGYVPQQRLQREFRPWLVGLLLALPLPLLMLLFAPALALSRRHADRARSGGSIRLDVSSWRDEAERIVPAMKEITAGRLDRHVRPGFDEDTATGRRALDIRRTLASTLRRHGALSLRWQLRRARPSYLVLIDLRDEHDLRGRLFFRWADRLRQSRVAVEVWLFDGDPRTLYPAEQRRVFDAAGRARNGVPLHQVVDRAAAEPVRRLVVVSDGQAFFGEGDALCDWWPQLGWQQWRERVMFTPVDPRDWGRRELAIERPLGRGDPGFLVLPLEQEALDAYAVRLTTGELPSIVLAGARRYPPLLEQRPELATRIDAPADEDVEKLIAQLRLYLGENGLRWFAACAVPPLTRWELTLLIGQALFRDMGTDDDEGLRWLMASNYPRLARLPWLRQAFLPDWLALRLLGELSVPVQDRIRKVVRELLDSVPTHRLAAGDDTLVLDCTPPSAAAAAGAARPAGEAEAEAGGARQRREWLYLGFLDGLSSRQLAMRAPLAWRQWFGRPVRSAQQRGLREWLALALDWLRAFAARLMWRDGRAESGASPLPLALAAAWVVGIAVGLVWVGSRADGTAPAWLVDALMSEARIDGGARSETALRSFGFSADGARFFTVDEDGDLQVHDERGRAVGVPLYVGAPTIAFLEAGGERLLTVDEGELTRWDLRSGRRVRQTRIQALEGWRDAVPSRDGRWLALVSAQGRQVALVDLRDAGVRSLAVEGEGSELSVAFEDNDALVTLRGDNVTVRRLPALDAFARPPSFTEPELIFDKDKHKTWLSPDGRRVALLTNAQESTPTRLGLYDLLLKRIWSVGLDSKPTVVALGENSMVAFARSADTLEVWDADANVRIGSVKARTPPLQEARFIDGGSALLVRDAGETIGVYDTSRRAGQASTESTPAPLMPLGQPLKHRSPVVQMVVAPAGDALLTAARGTSGTQTVRLWQPARLAPDPSLQDASSDWRMAALAPDGRRAAAGSATGEVIVWAPASARPITRFKAHDAAPGLLAFGAGGSTLISADADGRLRLSDANDGRRLAETDPTDGPLLATLAAATRFATVTGDGVQLWTLDRTAWQRGARIDEHGLVAYALSPTGEELLTGGTDGTVRLRDRDLQRTRELHPFDDALVEAEAPAPQPQPVLDVLGLPLAAAKARLLTAGFAVQWTAETRDAAGATIDGMEPRSGTMRPPGSTIVLKIRRATTPAVPRIALNGVLPRLKQGVEPGALPGCIDGYVERRAFDGDRVCVTPATRARVIDDNAARAKRIDSKDTAYGPETCQQGFVWREADRYLSGEKFFDRTCVTPAERAQTAGDNELRATRRALPEAAQNASPPSLGTWRESPAAPAPVIRDPDRLLGLSFEDQGRLVLAQGAAYARLFNAETLQRVGQTAPHAGLVGARYWPHGGMILTAGRDGLVRFWETPGGRESLPPLRHGGALARIELAPDGDHLATIDRRGGMQVWELGARRPLPGPALRAAPARGSVAFDAGGHRLAAAVPDGAPFSARLPGSEPGILRTVTPHATLWLDTLLACGAISLAGIAALTRRRALQLRRLAGFGDTSATPAPRGT